MVWLSHRPPGLKWNQPNGVWLLLGGQEQPVVNIALVSHTQSSTVNCHQLIHKQVPPKQNPAQHFQQPSPPKLGNALSLMSGTITQHHTALFQGAVTDIRICLPCFWNPRIIDKSHKPQFPWAYSPTHNYPRSGTTIIPAIPCSAVFGVLTGLQQST